MVNWHVSYTDGTTNFGSCHDGSWKSVQSGLTRNRSIRTVTLANDRGAGHIDINCDGYFVGNKLHAGFPNHEQLEMVGLGYWRKHDDMVRIKWFNPESMELLTTEAKPISTCGPCLIKNPLI